MGDKLSVCVAGRVAEGEGKALGVPVAVWEVDMELVTLPLLLLEPLLLGVGEEEQEPEDERERLGVPLLVSLLEGEAAPEAVAQPVWEEERVVRAEALRL